jgi:hypothetical protein
VGKRFPIAGGADAVADSRLAMKQLEVCPRLLADPAMWSVEVRDSITKRIIWSSWADEWCAYDTADDAKRRAAEIVARLTSSAASAA